MFKKNTINCEVCKVSYVTEKVEFNLACISITAEFNRGVGYSVRAWYYCRTVFKVSLFQNILKKLYGQHCSVPPYDGN